MTSIIIIYLSGYIASYFIARYNRRKNLGENYDWDTIYFLLLFSIFSWCSFAIVATDPSTYSFNGKVKSKTKSIKDC